MEQLEAAKIVETLEQVVNVVMSDTRADRYQLGSRLDFMARVVQVFSDTYQTLYVVLMRASLLTASDLESGHADELAMRVDRLVATGFQFDAEIIANRLRALREESHEFVRNLIEAAPSAADWHFLLNVIDERGTPIVTDLQQTAFELRRLLGVAQVHAEKLGEVHAGATAQATVLRPVLIRAQRLTNWMLGLHDTASAQAPAHPQAATTPAGARYAVPSRAPADV